MNEDALKTKRVRVILKSLHRTCVIFNVEYKYTMQKYIKRGDNGFRCIQF